MHGKTCAQLCGSLLAIAFPSATQAQTASDGTDALDEIIVTARRREESVQDVPQVVNALPAETLQKLAIKDFRDIQTVVPGLNISGTNSSIRGVSFNALTSSQPTVAFYLNETLVEQQHLFQILYDIGQIEVLRGPQGTNRGVAAPSGAITLTTRRPDLSEFGGYVDVLLNTLDRRYINGAINIPIVTDKLALRVAGAIDRTDGSGVRSYFSNITPSRNADSIRATLHFEPNDSFSAVAMYQRIENSSRAFSHVFGPGSPGFTPPISPFDRRAVQDVPTTGNGVMQVVTGQIDWHVAGHVVSYVGGYSHNDSESNTDNDTGQNLIGVPVIAFNKVDLRNVSQELRIASEPEPGRFVDYVVGGFYRNQRMTDAAFNLAPSVFLPNAFGSPLAPSLAAFDPRFQSPLRIPTGSLLREKSLFASVTLHLGERTELTGGLRHLWVLSESKLRIISESGLIASPVCPSPTLLPGPSAGTCIVPALGVVAQPPVSLFREQDTIYNLSLSHKFTPDLMVYATFGTSYRPPYSSIGVNNFERDPVLAGFMVHPSESSKSYEAGFKWTFFDGHARLNASYFHQKFSDLPTQTTAVPYISNAGAGRSVQNFAFTADPDAVFDGFDIEAWFRITPHWTFSAQGSYSKGRVASGSGLPCNDGDFDGTPDSIPVTSPTQFPPGVFVAICPGGNISQLPRWNATFQTEYTLPVTDKVDAYLRGLFSYYPENPYATTARVIENYGLLNLFAGARANDGSWEVGLFARNILNTQKVTNQGVNQLNNANSVLGQTYRSLARNSGYFSTDVTPRQEFGVTVRYAFGSR